MTGRARADVLVSIPAHNEADLLPCCLDSVLAAIAHSRAQGAVQRATIVVAAHRCSDRTEELAQQRLTGAPVESIVLRDTTSTTIADVRRTAVEAALPPPKATAVTWLFNTDADSQVPRDWITGHLAVATREQAVASAGLIAVADWHPTPETRQAYNTLIAQGVHGAHHYHAYGANLAVRLDAYQTVGGFTPRDHGEEHDLLHRLRMAQLRVATPLAPQVTTSGRDTPRCSDGLGAFLHRLPK